MGGVLDVPPFKRAKRVTVPSPALVFHEALEKMWDSWMAYQGYDGDRRATIRKLLKEKIEALWSERSWRNDVQELSKMQCPRLMMQFVIHEGMIRSYSSLPEEWRVFLDFLQVKTQPMLATPLRQNLLESPNDLMWLGMLEELLAEVCPTGQQAPITKVDELVAYIEEHQKEMHVAVTGVHNSNPSYQTVLADIERLVANRFKTKIKGDDRSLA